MPFPFLMWTSSGIFTIEERVWLIENIFRNGSSYTDAMRQLFAEKFSDKFVPDHNAVCKLVE